MFLVPVGEGLDPSRLVQRALPLSFLASALPDGLEAEAALVGGARDVACLRFVVDHHALVQDCHRSVESEPPPARAETLLQEVEALGALALYPVPDGDQRVASFGWLAVLRRCHGDRASHVGRVYLAAWFLYLRRLDAAIRANLP